MKMDVRPPILGADRLSVEIGRHSVCRELDFTLQPGDTLRSLADRYGRRVADLARINRFSRRSDIVPGQELVIYADPTRLAAARAAARREQEAVVVAAREGANEDEEALAEDDPSENDGEGGDDALDAEDAEDALDDEPERTERPDDGEQETEDGPDDAREP